ncbi:endospore germination permease [Neobacillus sp. OS1-33]|uniref:GerAB/ArcD/ProY family transporter n=1 Tax=Neobacillus sp. OS1-33 TaxID=3070683 RepID=UPI0027DF2FD6|nr:endospore germination permease [Neobacillus sp. OS1-33]WML23886.1 endospore germination permease [Neobacillus sp. OS1-33]
MKISGLQVFWLMFTFETGNMILLTLSPTFQDAKQDAWISYLLAAILGILIVFVSSKAALLYPGKTLIEYSKLIFGKWLGILIVIVYLIQWYSVLGDILREFAEFTITILLPTTPMWVLVLTMLLLLIYITYSGGIEGIGRCSEVFGPIILLSVLILLILSVSIFNYKNFLPVFSDTGFVPILKGTLHPLSFLGESVMMLMLLSFMDQPNKGPKRAVWGIAAASCLVSTVAIWVLLVLGPEIASGLRHPAFDAVSYITVMDFIQNLEIIAVLIWILSVFIKLSLYFFLANYGTAQLFHIKKWRKLIWVTSTFFFILAIIFPNPTYTYIFDNTYWIYFALPVNMVGIPLLLWFVGSLRKKIQANH